MRHCMSCNQMHGASDRAGLRQVDWQKAGLSRTSGPANFSRKRGGSGGAGPASGLRHPPSSVSLRPVVAL